jgi:hypothetical protein
MTEYDPSGEAYFPQRPSRPSIAPIIIGGVVAAVMLALRSPLAAWLRGFLADWPNPAQRSPHPLVQRGFMAESIRGSVLGRGKSAIAAVYGPPRTAAAGRTVQAKSKANFWKADTWYYPLDATTHMAMAVRFENGIARHVEFFQAPGIAGGEGAAQSHVD